MNSNLQGEFEFLPTDFATWIAPIRSLGSITAVFNDASLLAMERGEKAITAQAFNWTAVSQRVLGYQLAPAALSGRV